jgi:AraC family transcriptional regulator of adaptative response/methylated-DNA-[protein]-cysteine methyltransferase
MTQDLAGEQAVIRYAISRSRLGRMLVARTDRGICYVGFDDDPRVLKQALRSRFALSRIERDDRGLRGDVQALAELLSDSAGRVDLPLDLRGTPFQLRVWELLRRIPVGHTTTYRELARRMGRPKAVRAVASACGANPVAVAVPCHRVLRSDGGLGGYYWGIERKRRLLQLETDMVQKSQGGATKR